MRAIPELPAINMGNGVRDGDNQYGGKAASGLRQLLDNPRIWISGRSKQSEHLIVPTGFGVLDEWLGGGWPLGVLTELFVEQEGAGELRLLMPALAQLSKTVAQAESNDHDESGVVTDKQLGGVRDDLAWLAWIAPPHIPYPPALKQHGVDISRLLVTRSDNRQDILWATEQSLRSAVCLAVLAWLGDATDKHLRRLQLAAEYGSCWAVIFRSQRFAQSASPAPLRICVRPGSAGPELEILRNRYGRVGRLNLPC